MGNFSSEASQKTMSINWHSGKSSIFKLYALMQMEKCKDCGQYMCRQNEYRDEVSGRCLNLCGVNNTKSCLIDEYCHHSSGICRNKCQELCDRSSLYCDPHTTHCLACEDVCDPYIIDEFPDCQIHCPEQFMLLKGGHTPGVKSTTATPSSTPVLSALPSLATATLAPANGKSYQYIIISVICVIVIALIVVLVIFAWRRRSNNRGDKRNTREVSSRQEDAEQMLRETEQALASTSEQTTANYHPSGSSDKTSTSQDINVLDISTDRLSNEGLLTDNRRSNSHPTCHENIPEPASRVLDRRQLVHTISEQGPHSIDSGCNPLYTSHRSLASFPSYKSVNSFCLSPDEELSFSGFSATQIFESPGDTPVDAKTFYAEQIRQIKSFDWGSVGNLDLREDGLLPPDETTGVVFQMPDLNLPTPTPSLQARIDEKIAIMEILDEMEFVEFHLFSRDKVTVVIKNNSISLVEARKQLLDAGVPDRMFTVEYLK